MESVVPWEEINPKWQGAHIPREHNRSLIQLLTQTHCPAFVGMLSLSCQPTAWLSQSLLSSNGQLDQMGMRQFSPGTPQDQEKNNLLPFIKKEKRRKKKEEKKRPGDRVSHRNTGDKLLVTAWVGRESTALEQNGGSKHESYYLNYTRL